MDKWEGTTQLYYYIYKSPINTAYNPVQNDQTKHREVDLRMKRNQTFQTILSKLGTENTYSST
jgi:hypothetical protein